MPWRSTEERKAYQHAYYVQHREKLNDRRRTRERTAIGKASNRKYHLKKWFGVTTEWYDAKLCEQNGGCAICGKPEAESRWRRLAIDHDHNTGEVRGLLCFVCNTKLGVLEDVAFKAKAKQYLKNQRHINE